MIAESDNNDKEKEFELPFHFLYVLLRQINYCFFVDNADNAMTPNIPYDHATRFYDEINRAE